MRVVLDEGIPRSLAAILAGRGIDATAFPDAWRGLSDKRMMEAAVPQGFSVLITQDRNMFFQRPLGRVHLAVLIVPEMDRKAVLAKADDIALRIPTLEPGRYGVLGLNGSLPDPPVKPLKAR
jgi:hypothetical protein